MKIADFRDRPCRRDDQADAGRQRRRHGRDTLARAVPRRGGDQRRRTSIRSAASSTSFSRGARRTCSRRWLELWSSTARSRSRRSASPGPTFRAPRGGGHALARSEPDYRPESAAAFAESSPRPRPGADAPLPSPPGSTTRMLPPRRRRPRRSSARARRSAHVSARGRCSGPRLTCRRHRASSGTRSPRGGRLPRRLPRGGSRSSRCPRRPDSARNLAEWSARKLRLGPVGITDPRVERPGFLQLEVGQLEPLASDATQRFDEQVGLELALGANWTRSLRIRSSSASWYSIRRPARRRLLRPRRRNSVAAAPCGPFGSPRLHLREEDELVKGESARYGGSRRQAPARGSRRAARAPRRRSRRSAWTSPWPSRSASVTVW